MIWCKCLCKSIERSFK